ncbi:helix-turn-helix domain-containing protein [Streptomyces sp. NPDC004542]|uniref:PucR family transcriptional regulator n=1 Tax=Streptomyces sp. NPDC004542 TaxID=3154281 RepID=UPI0033A08683
MGTDTLQRLVETLAARLRRSVVVDDPLARLVCSSQHFGDADPVRIRSLLQGRADDEVIRYVLDQGVAQWPKPGFIAGHDELELLTRYCVPLRERGHLVGLLMVVAPDGTLAEDEAGTVAEAVPAIAAQMYALQLAATEEATAAQDALLALVDTSPVARASARQQLLTSGLLTDAAHALVSVVRLSPSPETPGQAEIALRAALEPFLRTRAATGIMAVAPDSAVLLQLYAEPVEERELAAQSAAILRTLRTYLAASAAPVLGIGGVQDGLANAWVSHSQAVVAARAARRMPYLEHVGVWDALGEYAVLLQVPAGAFTSSLLPKPLRMLLESPVGRRLETTLRCFLKHAGSIPRTAETLGIHRTSLHYRLRQIQEITGLDLDSGDDRLVLHLGLRIHDLLEPSAAVGTH